MNIELLSDEEINAYVQYEAGNTEYFKISEEQYAAIGEKIRSSDIHLNKYENAKKVYHEILKLEEKKKFPFLAIAASLIFVVMAGLLFFLNVDDTPDVVALASKYGTNETLDKRVENPLRGVAITDIIPSNNSVFQSEVVMSWETSEPVELTLKIYDKEQNVLFDESTSTGSVKWKASESKVYYWSLEDEQEILHWGKFYVE